MNTKNAFERRSDLVNVRLTPPDKLRFEQVAQRLNTTASRLLRKMIRELVGQGPDFLEGDMKTIEQAMFQVGAVGRNLNQLLRAVHSGRPVASSEFRPVLDDVLRHVEQLRKELHRAIDRARNRWERDDPSAEQETLA